MLVSVRETLRNIVRLAAVACLVAVAGCASTGPSGGGETRDPDLLTHSDFQTLEHLSAYDVVRRLRPTWLRTGRGPDSFSTQGRRAVRVYVNGTLHGTVSELRQIAARDVDRIRHLDPRQATTEFGTDHTEGALLVTLR